MVVTRKVEDQTRNGDLLLEIQNMGEGMPAKRQHIRCMSYKLPAKNKRRKEKWRKLRS